MARPKTYIIKLSDDERAALQKTIRSKKTCKTVLKRCQILLELDEEQGTGLTHAQIAHTYAVCPATITHIVQSYAKNGITDIIRYNISPIPVPLSVKWKDVPKHALSKWPAGLSRRIVDIILLRQELAAWESDRNEHTAYIEWQFTADNARTKLASLYPKFGVIVKNN